MPILLKLFEKTEVEETLLKTFYDTTVNKDNTTEENYKLISLVNIDRKIFNKILANWIWKHIKKAINHDQVGFIPGSQGWFNTCKLINAHQQKDKTHMIISMDAEKAFDKIQHSCMIKILMKMCIEWTYLIIVKVVMTNHSQYNTQSWKPSYQNLEQDKDACSHHFSLKNIGSL